MNWAPVYEAVKDPMLVNKIYWQGFSDATCIALGAVIALLIIGGSLFAAGRNS